MSLTPQQAADNLKALGQEVMDKTIVNAVRAALNSGRVAATKKFISRGVGHKIWGGGGRFKKASSRTLRLIINRDRVRRTGAGTFTAGIRAKGLAGISELGGKTEAHVITPKFASILKLANGAFARRVNHPGSRMPRDPFLESARPVIEREYAAKLEKGIEKARKKAGLE